MLDPLSGLSGPALLGSYMLLNGPLFAVCLGALETVDLRRLILLLCLAGLSGGVLPGDIQFIVRLLAKLAPLLAPLLSFLPSGLLLPSQSPTTTTTEG